MKDFEPKQLNKETRDGAEMNLDALYQLFPSCFTEAPDALGEVRRVVDWQKLRALLGEYVEDGEPEVYDFTWVGKRAAQREAATPCRKTLRPCPEESVDWENTQNLYIEGDNLEVLKLLQNSYMGKVKMIYIDPPYNTGNDFVYHDDFHRTQQEEDEAAGVINEEGERMVKNTSSNGKFHSDWCSMIYSRLMIARSLLREDGVVFISIDDNEIENLRKICDEVFGELNFLNQFVWLNKIEGRQIDGPGAAGTHEYVLLYAKNYINLTEFTLSAEWLKAIMPSTYKGYNFDVKTDEHGAYITTHELHNGNSKFNEETRPTLVFDIYYRESDGDIKIEEVSNSHLHVGYSKITPHINADGTHKYHAYRWSREKILKEKYNLEFVKSGNTYKVYSKRRDFDLTTVRDIITDITTNNGNSELNSLDIVGFSYPKPTTLLKILINMITRKSEEDEKEDYPIILDFFSGSATTAHTVIQLNANDSVNRRFIMVQWPEETPVDSEARIAGYPNICEIGKERIRRAGKKIKTEHPEATDLDIGFRVLKCDESNFKPVAFAPSSYEQSQLDMFLDNIKSERTGLDLLFDCMMRWGLELSLPYATQKVDGCTLYNVDEGSLVACFEGNVTEAVIDAIAQTNPVRVVFRDSSFKECAEKMNLFELFKQKCGWTDEEVKNNVRVI
jgi:adenine-specific DNA-methyltransferase